MRVPTGQQCMCSGSNVKAAVLLQRLLPLRPATPQELHTPRAVARLTQCRCFGHLLLGFMHMLLGLESKAGRAFWGFDLHVCRNVQECSSDVVSALLCKQGGVCACMWQ
jgi:hypothetical protein